MFILSSISRGLEFFLVYKNYESKFFKNKKCLGEISNNSPNDLLEANVYETFESC